MARILPINNVSFLSKTRQNNKADKNVCAPNVNSHKFSQYSTNNLKAHFVSQAVSFTAGQKELVQNFAYEDLNKHGVGGVLKYDDILPTFDGNFYDNLADEAIITLDKKGNLLITHEPEASRELLVESIKKNVADGKYRSLGIGPENTQIHVVNDLQGAAVNFSLENEAKFKFKYANLALNQLKKEGQKITKDTLKDQYEKVITQLSHEEVAKGQQLATISSVFKTLSEATPRHGIVFINDFPSLNASVEKLKIKHASDYFDKYSNLHFITFLPIGKKDVKRAKSATLGAANSITDLIPAAFKSSARLEMPELSIKDTKEFLRKNPTIIEAVLENFQEANLKLPQRLIDPLVDMAVKEVDMPLPAAALILLHDIAADALIKTKDIYKNAHKASAYITLSDRHLKEYSKAHKALNKAPEGSGKLIPAEGLNTKMSDIIGVQSAKNQLQDLMDYVKNPEAFVAMGREPLGGAVLAGPPGTAKTTLLRAVANACGVPFFAMKGSDFGSSYQNSGKGDVNKAYEDVLDYLKKTGQRIGFLAIDEGEQIVRRRTGGVNDSDNDKTTGAVLSHTEGFSSKDSYHKVITLITTNNPEVIDPALLDRPSRLGKPIWVDILHKKEERYQLLQMKSGKKPFANEAEKAKLLEHLAVITEGLNGDQITKALDNATRDALKTKERVITKKHIVDGFFNMLYGEKSELDATPAERIRTCLHEAGHAVAITRLKDRKLVAISNEPRGKALAFVYSIDNDGNADFAKIANRIAGSLGGGEAEKLANPGNSAGVVADHESLTNLMEKGIKKWHVAVHTPPLALEDDNGVVREHLMRKYEKQYSKDTDIFLETGQRLINNCLEFDKDFILNKYMPEIEEAVNAGKDGKNYLGDEFLGFEKQWLIESGKIKAEPVLDSGLEAIRTIAQTEKKWFDLDKTLPFGPPAKTLKVEINSRTTISDGVDEILKFVNKTDWHSTPDDLAQHLIKHIDQLTEIAKNPIEWVVPANIERTNSRVLKAVEKIVKSAKGEKLTVKSTIQNLLHKIR